MWETSEKFAKATYFFLTFLPHRVFGQTFDSFSLFVQSFCQILRVRPQSIQFRFKISWEEQETSCQTHQKTKNQRENHDTPQTQPCDKTIFLLGKYVKANER